jgi:hypothetical protein
MTALRKTWEVLRQTFGLRDMLAFGGLVLVGVGIANVFWPAALVAVGIVLFWMGVKNWV